MCTVFFLTHYCVYNYAIGEYYIVLNFLESKFSRLLSQIRRMRTPQRNVLCMLKLTAVSKVMAYIQGIS